MLLDRAALRVVGLADGGRLLQVVTVFGARGRRALAEVLAQLLPRAGLAVGARGRHSAERSWIHPVGVTTAYALRV